METCNCERLDRTMLGNELLTTHAKDCPGREVELRAFLESLCFGIDSWAHDEDNEVHPDLWEAYKRLRLMLGKPVPAELSQA